MLKIKTVTTGTASYAGGLVEATPVIEAEGGYLMPGGSLQEPIAVEEDPNGIPVRFVTDAVVLNSAGHPVGATPVTGVGVIIDPDTDAYFARMASLPTGPHRSAIASFAVRGKAYGWYSTLEAFHLFAGDDLPDGQLNLIGNNSNLVKVGTVNFLADRGFYGDGSTGYFTGWGAPSTRSKGGVNDSHTGVAVLKQGNGRGHVGRAGTSDKTLLECTTSQIAFRENQDATSTWTTKNSVGITSINRRSGTTVGVWRNGTKLQDVAVASSSRSALALTVSRANANYGTDAVGANWFGASMTDDQLVDFHGALTDLLAAFGWTPIPAIATSSLVLQSALVLPDASGSNVGKGLGGTGIWRDGDGTWWIANHAPPNNSSLCHVSADFSTLLAEFPLSGMGIGTTTGFSAQGVAGGMITGAVSLIAKDPVSTGSKVVHVDKITGLAVSSFAVGVSANGLAYDSIRDRAVISGSTGAYWADKSTGVQEGSAVAFANAPDQLHFDAANNHLLYSHDGASGVIGRLSLSNMWGLPVEIENITLPGAGEIEGFAIYNGGFAVMNDGDVHDGSPDQNRVLFY